MIHTRRNVTTACNSREESRRYVIIPTRRVSMKLVFIVRDLFGNKFVAQTSIFSNVDSVKCPLFAQMSLTKVISTCWRQPKPDTSFAFDGRFVLCSKALGSRSLRRWKKCCERSRPQECLMLTIIFFSQIEQTSKALPFRAVSAVWDSRQRPFKYNFI